MSKQLGVRVPDDIAEYMDLHDLVNWSGVIRQSLKDYINRKEMATTVRQAREEAALNEFCDRIKGDFRVYDKKASCKVKNVEITLDTYKNRLSVEITDEKERPHFATKTLEFECDGESKLTCISGSRFL